MSKLYELGPFVLDPLAGTLIRSGAPTSLGARGVAVLAELLEHPNEYVSKSRIMDAAWPGLVVEESNLAVQISAIRRALADAPGGEHWVETLPRRGYRFIGPVAEVDRPQSVRSRNDHTNLPEALTSFIGRERELLDIKQLLPGRRLVTVVGAGGIGKTRLALQLASEAIDDYRDGVWLVELGSINDPSLVPASVAQVLGVQEKSGTPLTQTLCSYINARQLLLIVDNCEHLLDACAKLADAVLGTAAQATILATSREPLHVAGEQTYPLQALSLPESGADADQVARSEAVQLFVERARRQLPDFELTAARAAIVADLCIHLDGIPLALELAAARVRTLSVEQIHAHLHDRFKLLTAGSRTALPRQQTLRHTLDWSFDLLGEQERAVLRRLAVFAGGFTLEAASAVASEKAMDEYAVIDLLSQLVARSLVVASTIDGSARYRLLETTRAYALEKLAESGETEALQRMHAEYFRDRFERAYDDWLRMRDDAWRAIYLPERDNVRIALDWALGAVGDSAIGISLAGASGALWAESSLLSEGRCRLEAAVAQVESRTSDADQARLWLWLGLLQRYTAPAQVTAMLERAVDLYRTLGDPPALGHSLVRLGAMLAKSGRFEDSARALAEAFQELQHAQRPKVLGAYFTELGLLTMLAGDPAGARKHYEKALSLYRETGAESAALAALGLLADMTWTLGDLDAALAAFVETVARLRRSPLGRQYVFGVALINLAGVRTERGELDEALVAAREGLPLLRDAGIAWNVLDHLALRAALAGKLADAARLTGFVESAHAANDAIRQPNEVRAYDRVQTLLREKLGPDELHRLIAEGGKMSEDAAYRLALEE
ncbi:MAG TPA: winged helix-turn-helix domain-containing protein [Casimicrobiaceae bacterium]|nr:winged helix-turn-helix domain-containing protein [Casimicrobiaceae bacterium]